AATSCPGQLGAALITVAAGASAGDHLGYWIGSRFGTRLRSSRVVRRIGVHRWERATTMLRRNGVLALVVSRLLPGVRTLMPAVAGAAGLGYGRFLAGSVVGAGLWSGLWVGVGAAARSALPEVAATLGEAGWGLLGAVLLLGSGVLGLLRWRRRRQATEQVPTAAAQRSDQPCPRPRPAPLPCPVPGRPVVNSMVHCVVAPSASSQPSSGSATTVTTLVSAPRPVRPGAGTG